MGTIILVSPQPLPTIPLQAHSPQIAFAIVFSAWVWYLMLVPITSLNHLVVLICLARFCICSAFRLVKVNTLVCCIPTLYNLKCALHDVMGHTLKFSSNEQSYIVCIPLYWLDPTLVQLCQKSIYYKAPQQRRAKFVIVSFDISTQTWIQILNNSLQQTCQTNLKRSLDSFFKFDLVVDS